MKKVLLTALVAAFGLTGTAYAQFTQGTISVGGGVSFSSVKSEIQSGNTTVEYPKESYFELSPSVGYFLADDLEAGLQIGLSSAGEESNALGNEYSRTSSLFIVGPYVRKYFTLSETAAFFGEASIGFGGGKTRMESDNASVEYDNVSAFSLGITPGFMYRPTNRVGIQLSAGLLGYNSLKIEDFDGDEETYTESDFGLNLNLRDVSLGVKLFF